MTRDGLPVQARRSWATPWRDPRLIGGVALIALSAVLGGLVISSDDEQVLVWQARRDLVVGTAVAPGDLVRVPVGWSTRQASAYLSGTRPPAGVLRRSVGTGELLPRSALSDAATSSILLVPLQFRRDDLPFGLVAGDRIQVWAVPAESSAGSPSPVSPARLVAADLDVVQVEAGGPELSPEGTRSVTVAVRSRGALARLLGDAARARLIASRAAGDSR